MDKGRICPLCERIVDEELFQYHYETEIHLLEKIVKRYPAWAGNRDKVLDFYRLCVLPEANQENNVFTAGSKTLKSGNGQL